MRYKTHHQDSAAIIIKECNQDTHSTTWCHHTKKQVQKHKFLDDTSIGEIYIKNSRIEHWENKTWKENNDYYKHELKQPDIEMTYSARSSSTTPYKHKSGLTVCTKNCSNSIRPINDNHIALEQYEIQELCLREISHQEKYNNSKILTYMIAYHTITLNNLGWQCKFIQVLHFLFTFWPTSNCMQTCKKWKDFIGDDYVYLGRVSFQMILKI